MNNLIFNKVASELKTLIYGKSKSGEIIPINTDNEGNIIISKSIVVTEFYEEIDITPSNSHWVSSWIDISEKSLNTFMLVNQTPQPLVANIEILFGNAFLADTAAGTLNLDPDGGMGTLSVSTYASSARIRYNVENTTGKLYIRYIGRS